jgi:hypothetical protein
MYVPRMSSSRYARILRMMDNIIPSALGACVCSSFACAAAALLEPAVGNNILIYPPLAVRDRFELQRNCSPAEVLTCSRAWLQFKSGL